jgi:hypothetical protein
VLTLCTERRGQQVDLTYAGSRAMAVYKLPLNEVVFDFYDRLKSISRGYASFDYEVDSYAESGSCPTLSPIDRRCPWFSCVPLSACDEPVKSESPR